MPSQQYWDQQRKIQGCEYLGITPGQWSYIKRIGTILNNRYTADCNGDYNDHQVYQDRLTTKIEERVTMFAGHNGLYFYLQTDPRGATIYLDKKPIPDNNYTQAVCIY
jgi:hypothetical protein